MGISNSVMHSPDVSNNYTLENIRFRKCVKDHLAKHYNYKIVIVKTVKTGNIEIECSNENIKGKGEYYYSRNNWTYCFYDEKKLLLDYLYRMYSEDIFSYIKNSMKGKIVDKRLVFYIFKKCIDEVLDYIYSLKYVDKNLMSKLCLTERLQMDREY